MVLYKLHDFDPNYRDSFNGDDIKGMDVYSSVSNEKIGTVNDGLVDEAGRFRYLIVDTGFWIFGKKVLLPIGNARIDYNDRRVSANMSKQQAEALPNVSDLERVDYDQEEATRNIYRAPANIATTAESTPRNYNHESYNYEQHDAPLYNLNERNHQRLKLYEERLVASKKRVKTGEVTVGKRVETEAAHVEIPLQKEQVVVEHIPTSQSKAGTTVGREAFQEGEVARMEVYEEVPDIQKEAFVREEVQVRKETEQETAKADETVRRERLDVDRERRST
jgi:uncharacterized protein (TIGR02271 family)